VCVYGHIHSIEGSWFLNITGSTSSVNDNSIILIVPRYEVWMPHRGDGVHGEDTALVWCISSKHASFWTPEVKSTDTVKCYCLY